MVECKSLLVSTMSQHHCKYDKYPSSSFEFTRDSNFMIIGILSTLFLVQQKLLL